MYLRKEMEFNFWESRSDTWTILYLEQSPFQIQTSKLN